jgi:hypothetical protein
MIGTVVAGGIYNLALALFHVVAWKWLGLKRDLRFAMPQTRALALILNGCAFFFLALMGYICLVHGHELLTTPLGRTLLVGLTSFWLGRTIAQVIFFGWRSLFLLSWVLVFALGAGLFAFLSFYVLGPGYGGVLSAE